MSQRARGSDLLTAACLVCWFACLLVSLLIMLGSMDSADLPEVHISQPCTNSCLQLHGSLHAWYDP